MVEVVSIKSILDTRMAEGRACVEDHQSLFGLFFSLYPNVHCHEKFKASLGMIPFVHEFCEFHRSTRKGIKRRKQTGIYLATFGCHWLRTKKSTPKERGKHEKGQNSFLESTVLVYNHRGGPSFVCAKTNR